MKTRYKFLRMDGEKIKSNSGNCIWKLGEWRHEESVSLCNCGFHCSKEIYQAFSYVQGEVLAEVEVKGKSKKGDDKEVYTDMRLVRAWKWQKKDSVALSIYAAELCIGEYEKLYPNDKRPREAIEAAKKWLTNSTKENESAAWSAARSAESAAWSAAWSAESAAWSAESAAWSAARSAESAAWSAESAAWSAAESAARSAESAARKRVFKSIVKWFDSHLSELEEIK